MCSVTAKLVIFPSSTVISTFIGWKPFTSYTPLDEPVVAAASAPVPVASAACASASLIALDVSVTPDTTSNFAVAMSCPIRLSKPAAITSAP